MRRENRISWLAIVVSVVAFLMSACARTDSDSGAETADGQGAAQTDTAEGPHGGRLLTSGDFAIELAIFERGVQPEFRAWATTADLALDPREVRLTVKLVRLGGVVDEISFAPDSDFLRGGEVIHEPHSFEVYVEATHAGKTHLWDYEDFEGRTRIEPELVAELGIETAVAEGAALEEIVELFGQIRRNPQRVREIRARFGGVVRSVGPIVGSTVSKGEELLRIESDESLNSYTITAPIGGVVTQRDANPGEQTGGRLLMTITDTSSVWVEMFVFPSDRERVQVGNPVSISPSGGGLRISGEIASIEIVARPDQSVIARAVLDNPNGRLVPGTFAKALVTVAEHEVALAVRRDGLQAYRDFTVVYAQIGDEYEVRILNLGRRSREWVEVLGGLERGERYVTTNSFVVKADVEKSGASHDH